MKLQIKKCKSDLVKMSDESSDEYHEVWLDLVKIVMYCIPWFPGYI